MSGSLLLLLLLLLLCVTIDVNAQVASSTWLNRVVPLIDDVGRRAVQLGVSAMVRNAMNPEKDAFAVVGA
jgi:hypothetical protein